MTNPYLMCHGGPDMAPNPPNPRSAPGNPWRSSISRHYLIGGPDMAPNPPNPRSAPGNPWRSSISRHCLIGGPDMAPNPPNPRSAPGNPWRSSISRRYLIGGPDMAPNPPNPRSAPGNPWRSSISRHYSNNTSHQTRAPVSTITASRIRLSATPDNRRLASAPSCAPGRAPRATSSAGTSGTWCVASLPTTPAVAAAAVIASEEPMVTRIGTPTTTSRSGINSQAPPAPTKPAATPTPPAMTAVREALYSLSSAGTPRSSGGSGRNIRPKAMATITAKMISSNESGTSLDATAPISDPAAMAAPPTRARRQFTARWRPWAIIPDTAATNTWTIETPATILTSNASKPSRGGP